MHNQELCKPKVLGDLRIDSFYRKTPKQSPTQNSKILTNQPEGLRKEKANKKLSNFRFDT
jgi:hypothetical protein